MRAPAVSPQRDSNGTTRPLGLPRPRASETTWLPAPDRRPAQSLPARADGFTGPIRLVLRHVVRHSVFAEYDCEHCSRSYGRAMARYHH